MYAWSYILIQKNVRKQNKNEIPWIYMYKNFGRSKVQVTFHRPVKSVQVTAPLINITIETTQIPLDIQYYSILLKD